MAFIPEWQDCPECGEAFYQSEPWKRVCLPCWRESKDGAPQPRSSDADKLAYENLLLRQQVAQLKRRLTQPMDAPRPSFPGDMLARLIRLCHPDRHGGSDAANTATAWLLAQRNLT